MSKTHFVLLYLSATKGRNISVFVVCETGQTQMYKQKYLNFYDSGCLACFFHYCYLILCNLILT